MFLFSEQTLISRYNCFVCDYDICIDCKNIFEKEYNITNARKFENCNNKTGEDQKNGSIQKIVCLKTLCERVSELKSKKPLDLVDTAINTDNVEKPKIDKNENTVISIDGPSSILLGYESIPLIDVQVDPENPKKTQTPNKAAFSEMLHRKVFETCRKIQNPPARGFDSPDIFHLRAPLVSCENIMTPSSSKESFELK